MRTFAFALLAMFVASSAPALAAVEKDAPYSDPARLTRLVKEGKPAYFLMDVRTPAEYEAGHIPTAVNIPVDEIGTRPPTDTLDALLIVYCRSGARSASAQKVLEDLGYTNVVDFGSVSRWTGALITGKDPGTSGH
jgi:rhodanese-related sulfurtransferase